MSYIPKSAQRRIAAGARISQMVAAAIQCVPQLPVPRRMEIGVTPPGILGLFEVYVDGVKQRLCTLADADRGYVIRYRSGKGNKATTKETETIRGKVEIRRKGEARQTGQADHASAGGTSGAVAQDDSGAAAGVPRGPAAPETEAP